MFIHTFAQRAYPSVIMLAHLMIPTNCERDVIMDQDGGDVTWVLCSKIFAMRQYFNMVHNYYDFNEFLGSES